MRVKKLSLSARFGLVTSAVLIAYFLVLGLFHKHTNPAYSLFNVIITGFGIYEVIRLGKLEHPKTFSYSEGFKMGIITGFIATFLFSLFFLFYATEIDISFLPKLLETANGKFDADSGMITFVVVVMGLSTTVISTLTIMQILKSNDPHF